MVCLVEVTRMLSGLSLFVLPAAMSASAIMST